MLNYRCDICGGVLLYEKAKNFFHADQQKHDHLVFPVPRIWVGKPGDLEADDLADEEDGALGSAGT